MAKFYRIYSGRAAAVFYRDGVELICLLVIKILNLKSSIRFIAATLAKRGAELRGRAAICLKN